MRAISLARCMALSLRGMLMASDLLTSIFAAFKANSACSTELRVRLRMISSVSSVLLSSPYILSSCLSSSCWYASRSSADFILRLVTSISLGWPISIYHLRSSAVCFSLRADASKFCGVAILSCASSCLACAKASVADMRDFSASAMFLSMSLVSMPIRVAPFFT